MNTDSPKLCIDCAHYRAEEKELFDRCAHPSSQSGFVRAAQMQYCSVMRAHLCGKDAKLFQAKDSIG